MTPVPDSSWLSPRRAELASFEHAYAVALRIHAQTGRAQRIVRTRDPLQPYHVATHEGEQSGTVLAVVA